MNAGLNGIPRRDSITKYESLYLSQVWNTTENLTAIFLNVINAASGASSKLMDLRVDEVSKFNVIKDGSLYVGGTSLFNNNIEVIGFAKVNEVRFPQTWINAGSLVSDIKIYTNTTAGTLFFDASDCVFANTVTVNSAIKMPVGSKLFVATGTNQRAGEATLVAGTVTVLNASATTVTLVILSRKTIAGTAGNVSYTINNGVSFTITSSSALDISTFSYFLIEVA